MSALSDYITLEEFRDEFRMPYCILIEYLKKKEITLYSESGFPESCPSKFHLYYFLQTHQDLLKIMATAVC